MAKKSFHGNEVQKFNENEDEDIVDYIRLNEYIEGFDRVADISQQFTTDAYYCTGGDFQKILGKLILSQNLMFFEPNSNLKANVKNCVLI